MIRNSSKNHMDNQCQKCGCHCDSCVDNNSIHLHQEIEVLKQKLIEREQQIMAMESQILAHAKQFPNGEMEALRDKLYHWQDKYERLLENHRKLQKVNQGLEDKLLRVADRFENERIILSQNVNNLTQKLNEAQTTIAMQQKECLTLKNDYDLAIKIIQSIPTKSFQADTVISIESLPQDFQDRARKHLENQKRYIDQSRNTEPVRVPVPTFPPTAVLYSLNDNTKKAEKAEPDKPSNVSVPSSFLLKIIGENGSSSKTNLCKNCSEHFSGDSSSMEPMSTHNNETIII